MLNVMYITFGQFLKELGFFLLWQLGKIAGADGQELFMDFYVVLMIMKLVLIVVIRKRWDANRF